MRYIIGLAAIVLTMSQYARGQNDALPTGMDERSFDVRVMGAKGDGVSNDTAAIQRAIEACGDAGGGRVLFPPGRYLTSSLRLRSDVELHLTEGSRLVGSKDLDAYLGFESGDWGKSRWNRGLIVGEGLKNIAITGRGVIDGNKVFDPKGEAGMRGPHTILLSDCHDVRLDGVTIRDSANYAFFFYASTQVRVRNATFEGGWDGVHFRGNLERWNQDVHISDCRFFTGDDCIAGHYIKDGVVEECLINSSCNGVRLIGPADNLSFTHCEFVGPGEFEHRTPDNLHRTNMLAAIILQPSAWSPTPGPLNDVRISDITIRNVACALHVSIREGNTADRLTFEKITATDIYSAAVSLESWADTPIGDVTIRQLKVEYTPDAVIDPRLGRKPVVQDPIRKPGVGVWNRKLPVWGLYGRDVQRLHIDDVTLETNDSQDSRPVILTDNVEELTVDNWHHSPLPPTATAIECRKQ
jgi:polygalacturonase